MTPKVARTGGHVVLVELLCIFPNGTSPKSSPVSPTLTFSQSRIELYRHNTDVDFSGRNSLMPFYGALICMYTLFLSNSKVLVF